MNKLLLLAALPLAACDPAPAPGGDVVGTWRELPDSNDDPVPEDQRAVITFADDGTFTRDGGGDQPPDEGTYALDDGRITLTSGDSTFEVAYYADGARFLFGILEPDDDGGDVVATWSGYAVSAANGRLDNVITFAADHTVHLEQTTDEGTEIYDGTWAQTGADVEASFEVEENVTFSMSASLYDGFLGTPYEAI